ncbi:MAG TPA: HlyD family secretion protein [Stellaceae bacterium]|nr:HlyD family secretion protein [Stellaceae bacterium]
MIDANEPGEENRRFGRMGTRRQRLLLLIAGPLVVLAVAAYLYLSGGRYASTDDAYVKADKISVSADVGARVVEVDVGDNQPVKAGDVLFRLDDRPFRIALEHAQANLAAVRLQVEGLKASYRQKQADIKAAVDTLAYRQGEFDRQQQMLAGHVTSQARFDEAKNNLDVARQQVAGNQQQLANVLASLANDPDIETDKHPLVQQAQAQVDQAALDLSYTVVAAPADGIVTKVANLPVGEYLNASVPAFSLISTSNIWIEANFKETDLTHMLPGDKATVDVDTYPDKTFTAHVESIGAGTGSEFSVLPPQNATGNWVKVVQRIPVRLVIDNPDPARPLRAGMSANVEVDTGYSRITGWHKPAPPPTPAPAAEQQTTSPASAPAPAAEQQNMSPEPQTPIPPAPPSGADQTGPPAASIRDKP